MYGSNSSSILASLVMSLGLVACSSDSTPGAQCSVTKPCDDGLICDLSHTGGAICINDDLDDDADGLLNDVDLCPQLASADNNDEDDDGIGDVCDACPIAQPPATPETDNDGVDAPCDPDPKTGGAKIVVFQGFNGPLPATWKAAPTTTAWQVAGGIATVTSTGALEDLTVPITESTHIAMFADYRVDQANATTAEVGVVAVDNLAMAPTALRCGGQRIQAVDSIRMQTQNANSNQRANASLFDPTSLYGLLEQIDGRDASCAYNSTRYSDPIGGETNGAAMNKVGLYAQGAVVKFAYLLVVGR